MSRFLETLTSGYVLLMDGAMGTELQRAGLKPAECAELWSLTHPDRVRTIHRNYVKAGARCLLTNTFQANLTSLGNHGLVNKIHPINRAALDLARNAGGPEGFVLADVGPVTDVDLGTPADAAVQLVHMVRSFDAADALLLETQPNPLAMIYAPLLSKRRAPEPMPILLSVTFRRTKGKLLTITGQRPEDCAKRAHEFDLAALGVNCGRDIGMAETIEIIRRYRKETFLPLFARPNAGTPARVGGHWVYPQTPALMAERLPELLEAGVAMIGGCCGTTPDHIAAFKPIIDAWNARRREPGGH